jgi:hypothetical protein
MIKIFIFFNLFNLINNYPILLFPGLGGSRLIKDDLDIWPPKLKYFFFNNKEWREIIKNDKEIKTLEFGDKKSLDLHSNLPYLIKKNLFEDIMKNDNTYPIPYDFRLIHKKEYLEVFFDKLEKYIESFNKPVNCLTHSTGGLILHYFLTKKSDEWKKKYIKDVIYINVPFGGVLITLKEIITIGFYNRIIGKEILNNLGGFIINLPNKNIIKPTLIVDGKEYSDYFEYFNLQTQKEHYNELSEIIESFSKPNNVKTIVVYTSDRETPSLISIKNNKINLINGPGDGTVPLASLLFPNNWNQKDLQFYHLPNYEHSSVLFSEELLHIIHLLNDN